MTVLGLGEDKSAWSILVQKLRGTYATSATSTSTTSTSATAASAPAASALASLTAAGALAATSSTFFRLRGLRLAGQLHRDLAREDLLSGESLDSSGGLSSSSEVHKGVANGAVGAGVHRDRGALAVTQVSSQFKLTKPPSGT